MNLFAMENAKNLQNFKTTVLRREGGTWHQLEVSKLYDGLRTVIWGNYHYPEYLILFGHYTKAETLEALRGGRAYTAINTVGMDDKNLPFIPKLAE